MNDKISNYFIVGYMGSGKTTVGKVLADRLEKSFIDMDSEIEKEQEMTINRIFMKYGEHQFRNHEAELLDKIVGSGKDTIVSCGGGIILDSKNRDILKKEFVIYLNCSPDIMFDRIRNNPNLPNAYFQIKDEDERKSIFTAQHEKRQKFYEEISDITVDTSDKDIDGIAMEIIEKIGECK